MREQPPSDSEAHLAFAFSQKLPGPPPILGPTEMASCQPMMHAAALDSGGAHSRRIRNTVTNDSIAPNAQSLIWGVFLRIRFAFFVNGQPDSVLSERIVLRNAITAG
jgi:hypothetical protein